MLLSEERIGLQTIIHAWICSQHFVNGEKSNNPLAPNYIPTIFPQLSSPEKRKRENDEARFEKRQETKRKKTSAYEEQVASSSQVNCPPKMDITVQPDALPECSYSPAREDTDLTTPEQTTYNEEFDLVSSSSLNILKVFHIYHLRFVASFAPKQNRSLLMHWISVRNWNEEVASALLLKTVTRDSLVNAGAAEHIFHKGGPTYMQSCNYVAIAYKITQFSV